MAVTSSGSICCRGDSRPTLSGVTAVRQDATMVTVRMDAEAWLHADRARRSVIVPGASIASFWMRLWLCLFGWP